MIKAHLLTVWALLFGMSAFASNLRDVVISAPPMVSQYENTVLNGYVADPDSEIAHQTVYLNFYGKSAKLEELCTGFILANDLIATAGHCIDSSTSFVMIYFNDHVLRDFKSKNWSELRRSSHFKSFYRHVQTKEEIQSVHEFFSQKYLPWDENFWRRFNSYFNSLTDWDVTDLNGDNGIYSTLNQDFAIIYFNGGLPKGAEPVRFPGVLRLPFRTRVTIGGYGATSRKNFSDSNTQYLLHTTQEQLFRIIKSSDGTIYGFGYYNPNGLSACYGDSGAPVYVRVQNTLYVIAMNVEGFNDCRDSGAGIFPKQLMPRIEKWAQFFRNTYGPGKSHGV